MNDLQKNSLMSLIDNARNDHRSITKEVRKNLSLISEARTESVPWSKIAEALGFPGKLRQVQGAFSKWSKNWTKEKEKEVVPEKKKEAMPDAKAKTQKESTIFRSEDKAKGGRIGPPKPIGRGRFELGKDIPDDEL